ncbi:MAG TPA: D-2-hydroxyacid dehydrogenase [Terriglobia bacterium]|nr:D-2-hydroxyacid dehydrogenase [Terriglobia bacterium]
MKIVVLDGHALNPGDLSWADLERLGPTEIYDRTDQDLIFERICDAPVVLTNKTVLNGETMRRLPKLRYVGVIATGYNIVDMEAARDLHITVTYVPSYGTASVAQFTFALLLELCHRVGQHNQAVRSGGWSASKDWCFWQSPLVELAGKTMGLIGFGRIGRQVAKIADAMGMSVIATSVRGSEAPSFPDFRWASLDEILVQSDVVSLHCPLLPETEGLIDAKRLARMKRSAFLINTSRGRLVVEQDLANALNAERLAGAAVDVLSSEPPNPDNPLLAARNCIVTPHIAWATREARARLMASAIENVMAFLNGNSQNVVCD